MNILVFIKQVEDIRVPVACDAATGTVKTEWNVPVLNPDDGAAIEAALELKAGLPETRVTLINLGPRASERMIRDGLALGCDEGLRVWDEDLEGLHAQAKALILARVARTLPFDLILTGAGSKDTASAQFGLLLASSLRLPCITHATALRRSGVEAIAADRRLSRGYRQEVQAPTPLVITMVASDNERPGRYASLPALLEETTREIPCIDLADIGIPAQWVRQAESLLSFSPLCFPKARRKFIAAPDSSLPAYERREKLREGSIKRREGKIVKDREDAVVEELFQALLQGGWLDHLRKPMA